MNNKLKTAFFTVCDSKLQKGLPNSRNLDFVGFMNSFKMFHPDIPMIVFDETDMDKHGVNFYSAKATFGRILSKEYDLVVNVDSDHYFFDRCEEILKGDYDIACPANFNITDNLVGINVKSGINGASNEQILISVVDFLQGGLIASPNKQFWKHYEHAVNKYYNKFVCFENDVLNLVAYLYPYEVKILEGATDFRMKGRTCWYGCSIIGREKDCYIQNDLIMLDGLPVKAYHFAHGGGKKKYHEVFNESVSNFIKQNII
jgi:hypothetical protein